MEELGYDELSAIYGISAAALRSPRNVWEGGMQSILTGLADCLPDICYTEKYLD